MFNGFTDETAEFLMDLKFHNNTAFFHANHDRYVETVQTPFYETGFTGIQGFPGIRVRTGIITGSFSEERASPAKNACSIILNTVRTG